jgi:general secretion pathway protein B
MSYILEALADSEQARQQLAVAPRHSLLQVVGEDMPRSRVWPYALAGALLLNAALLQLWLRPALPGNAASIKVPILPQAAETPRAALEPRSAPVTDSAKPVADVADDAIRETRLPPSQPERANDPRSARKPAPAVVVPATVSLNQANDNAPVPLTIVLAPRPKAKPTAGAAATPAAIPSVAAPAAVATAATPAAVPSVAAPAAVTIAPAAVQAAPAPAGGADLPPALQRELPALSVAGFIRDEGSSSMVIVNDRLVREGDEVAPGVKLEKIHGDNLVFNYKGYRFKR